MTIFRLLRVRQWVKNAFVLAPLFFGFELLHRQSLLRAAAAFAIFCAVSSAVYIFNDWRDLEADRLHRLKRSRPLPSGDVSLRAAALLFAALMAIAAIVAMVAALPREFFVVLAIYVLVNVGYSLGLKQISLIELFLVASGFVLRLLAGAFAIGVHLSQWILIATAMVALLLTVGKRRADIAQQYDVEAGRKSLMAYNVAYLDLVLSALTGGTLVVYLLFCASDYAVGRFGAMVLATALPVALGLLRYLQLVTVTGKGASPTDLVLDDLGMLAILAVFVLMFSALIYF
jgi:decaprenyl-phosphate phosphoribosyltransferase